LQLPLHNQVLRGLARCIFPLLHFQQGKINILLEYMDLGSLATVLRKVGCFPEQFLIIIAFSVHFFIATLGAARFGLSSQKHEDNSLRY